MHNQIILSVYAILKKHSSEEKRLSKTEISHLLKQEYGTVCDRKSISRALDILKENIDDIGCTEKLRGNGSGEYRVRTDWYAGKTFTAEETAIFAESLLKNSEIPSKTRKYLLEKITTLGEQTFDTACIKVIKTAESKRSDTLITVIKAIKERKMLSFSVIELEHTEKLRLVRDEFGNVLEYLVKPIDIIATEGRFYLFGELGDSERYAYFLINELYLPQITDIEFSNENPDRKFEIPESRFESEFIIGGRREKIVIAISRHLLREFNIRFFGKTEIVKEYGGKVEIAFDCNINSALRLILQFGEDAEVISPSKLRRAVAITCKNTAGKYLASKQYRGHIGALLI